MDRSPSVGSHLPLLLSLLLTMLAGCGGSSSSDDPAPDPPFQTGIGFPASVFEIDLRAGNSGDIYVVGTFTSYNITAINRIARLNLDGTLDTGFSVGTGLDGSTFTVADANDGSGDVYAGGNFTSYDGNASNRIVRINSDGSLDANFDVGTGFNNVVNVIVPATDGSGDIYVGGAFISYNSMPAIRIVRLNNDGSIDGAFNVGAGFNGIVNTLATANDGSGDIYAGGTFTLYQGVSREGITRINSDGTDDNTFVDGAGFNSTVFDIAPATDGSGDIYVGGIFTSYDGTGSNRIVRLDSNGSLDAGFNIGTGFPNGSTVLDIAPATDGSGDIYVGGEFTSYDGNASNRIVRLNSDGSLDAGFVIGNGFDAQVRYIEPTPDGDVYPGGDFTTYDGDAHGRIIRLDSVGAPD